MLTKIKKMLKYRKDENFEVYAMRAMMHVSNLGRHRGYAEPSGVTGVAFFIPVLEVGKKEPVEKSAGYKGVKNSVVGGAAGKKICEKEAKKNLMNRLQVRKK